MAVVTNTRLPQAIGLEFAIPGIAVFHLMFFPLVTSHSVTARWPSPFPAAASPRNEGQFLGAPGLSAVAMGEFGAAADALGATGAAGAIGAADADAVAGATRANMIFAGPCSSCIDSNTP